MSAAYSAEGSGGGVPCLCHGRQGHSSHCPCDLFHCCLFVCLLKSQSVLCKRKGHHKQKVF